MSDYETVKVTRQDEVGVVSLNRPDSLNAFDAALRRDVLRAVREMNADDGVRVVVLTGEGRAEPLSAAILIQINTSGVLVAGKTAMC